MEKKKNDVRLNKSLRDVYIKDARRFLESQTNNPKYQAFLESRENCRTRIDEAFKTATAVVERRFNPTDVADLRRLQNKYTTVDSVGKDSCFYMAVVDDKGKAVNTRDEDNDEVAKSKHFDFNLKGNLNGSEYSRQKDFAHAWYREEMKANGLNPDCNIEHTGNQNNPHLSQHQNANSDWLEGSSGSSSNYVDKWNEDFALDIIGTGGCRSRAIPCTESEFATFEMMLLAKQQVVNAHKDWIGSIVRATNVIADSIKVMKYKSEVDALAKEFKWEPNVAINKTFGTALTINPASVKSMANEILGYTMKPTREEKIKLAKIALNNHLQKQVV
jgi:hypothetical protein